MTARPLDGIFVVDFTHVLAGPACAYMLGLLGADVVKVEGPRGDAMRWRGGTDADAARAGRSTAWATQAAGKRSLVLDLATIEGRAAMARLLDRADVLVENHLPQTLDHLGMADPCGGRPRLIHCAMTGYGRGGDLADAGAYDINIQAVSGLMTLTGTEDTGPLRAGAPVIDYATALAAGFAISAALLRRERTGEGGVVDVSMLEVAFTLMASSVGDMTATGHVPVARGNAANSRSPTAGIFPCRDGLLSLGVNEERQFHLLANALARDGWLDDPRFADRSARLRNASEMRTEITAALAPSSAIEWENELLAAGIPAAALRGLDAALDLPQVAARSFLQDLPSGARVPTLPFIVGAAPRSARSEPRSLGADTAALLVELGLSPDGDDPAA